MIQYENMQKIEISIHNGNGKKKLNSQRKRFTPFLEPISIFFNSYMISI